MSSEVRSAAELLKTAIDRHLEACERKQAEEDPAVQKAYDAVRDAAEEYDDALFEAYEEVSPFEYSPGPLFEPTEVADGRLPARVAVAARRDFAVQSVDRLLATGAAVLAAEAEDDEEVDADDLTPVEALALHLEANGLDAVTEASDDIGLRWLGGTTWIVGQDMEDETLAAAPFAGIAESGLLHRVDDEVLD